MGPRNGHDVKRPDPVVFAIKGGAVSFISFFLYAPACLLVTGHFSDGILPVIGIVPLFGGLITAGVGLIVAAGREGHRELERQRANRPPVVTVQGETPPPATYVLDHTPQTPPTGYIRFDGQLSPVEYERLKQAFLDAQHTGRVRRLDDD
jgi:hypothetical protein